MTSLGGCSRPLALTLLAGLLDNLESITDPFDGLGRGWRPAYHKGCATAWRNLR
ncbi:MAG: hypothetical protein QOE99_1736 [Actinomycetota bacterium]|nr:hypothetical protein [Actinomycetota bacterium]